MVGLNKICGPSLACKNVSCISKDGNIYVPEMAGDCCSQGCVGQLNQHTSCTPPSTSCDHLHSRSNGDDNATPDKQQQQEETRPATDTSRCHHIHCLPHHHSTLHLTSPHLTSPHLTSPHLTSPHLTLPHLTSSRSKNYLPQQYFPPLLTRPLLPIIVNVIYTLVRNSLGVLSKECTNQGSLSISYHALCFSLYLMFILHLVFITLLISFSFIQTAPVRTNSLPPLLG